VNGERREVKGEWCEDGGETMVLWGRKNYEWKFFNYFIPAKKTIGALWLP